MKNKLIPLIFSMLCIAHSGRAQEIYWRLTDFLNPVASTATIGYKHDLTSNFALGGSVAIQSNSMLPNIWQLNKKDFYWRLGAEAYYHFSHPRLKNFQKIRYASSEITYGQMAFLRFDDYFIRNEKKLFYQHASATRNEIMLNFKLGRQKIYKSGFFTEFFLGIGVKYKHIKYNDNLYKKAETLSDLRALQALLGYFPNLDWMDRQEGRRFRLIFPVGAKIGIAF